MAEQGRWFEVIRWKWEFLRRNSDYQNAYNKYSDLRRKLRGSRYKRINKFYYNDLETGMPINVHAESYAFGIKKFLDPSLTFSQLKKQNTKDELYYYFEMNSVSIVVEFNGVKILRSYKEVEFKLVDNRVNLNLWIDFDNQKHVIENDLLDLVSMIKKAHKNLNKKNKSFNFGYFDDCLKDYDMFCKGCEIDDIATKRYCVDDRDYARKKVRRNIKKAKEMIGTGYRHIT